MSREAVAVRAKGLADGPMHETLSEGVRSERKVEFDSELLVIGASLDETDGRGPAALDD